jgi:hypothetical protein
MSDIKPTNILAAVARANGITVDALIGRSRVSTIAAPRLVAFYLLRTETRLSFPVIGRLVERHHTTVMAACQSISDQLDRWPDGKTAKAVGRALEELALELRGNSDAAVALPCSMAEDSIAEVLREQLDLVLRRLGWDGEALNECPYEHADEVARALLEDRDEQLEVHKGVIARAIAASDSIADSDAEDVIQRMLAVLLEPEPEGHDDRIEWARMEGANAMLEVILRAGYGARGIADNRDRLRRTVAEIAVAATMPRKPEPEFEAALLQREVEQLRAQLAEQRAAAHARADRQADEWRAQLAQLVQPEPSGEVVVRLGDGDITRLLADEIAREFNIVRADLDNIPRADLLRQRVKLKEDAKFKHEYRDIYKVIDNRDALRQAAAEIADVLTPPRSGFSIPDAPAEPQPRHTLLPIGHQPGGLGDGGKSDIEEYADRVGPDVVVELGAPLVGFRAEFEKTTKLVADALGGTVEPPGGEPSGDQ